MANDWIRKWQVTKTGGRQYITSEASDGTYGCSCPAWTLQRKECKHIRMVKGLISIPSNYKVEEVMSKAATRSNGSLTTDWTQETLDKVNMTVELEKMAKDKDTWDVIGKVKAKNPPTILELIKSNAMYGGVDERGK